MGFKGKVFLCTRYNKGQCYALANGPCFLAVSAMAPQQVHEFGFDSFLLGVAHVRWTPRRVRSLLARNLCRNAVRQHRWGGGAVASRYCAGHPTQGQTG